MNNLVLSAAVSLTCLPVLAQVTIDSSLLLPQERIAPPVVTGTVCDLLGFVDAGDYALASPMQQQMLLRLAAQVRSGDALPHACWLGAEQPAVMALWNAVMQGADDFQFVGRWDATATSGSGLGNGDPTVITYSFVPDGTNVPAAVGASSGPSDLFATFNGGFPSQAIWQQRVGDALDRWGQLTGITIVFEPNDDGAQLGSAPGVAGVRGDVRIAGKSIDGASGSNILAYNYYPDNGDMVLDTDNLAFYSNSASNYLRLFNVVAHEHGHGIGIAHVCPTSQTKLMEPFISTAYSGPQYDDVLTGQRLYGDSREPNDVASAATDLGALGNGTSTTSLVSIDGSGDTDWYRFTVADVKTADVVLRPAGSPYLEGAQQSNGSCSPGTLLDPTLFRDLAFDVVDTDGSSVLLSVDQQPVGGIENGGVVLPAAGTYYLRVRGGPVDQVQLYDFDLVIGDGPPFVVQVVGGAPASVPADLPYAVDLRTVPVSGSADPSSGVLFSSVDNGPWQQSPLLHVGGDDFRGVLPPAPCLGSIRWYVTFVPNGGGAPLLTPSAAPAISFETEALTTVFEDDFESDTGWTVSNDAALTDGAWERGVPVGGGDRGDPATDADGSGQCYLTDNVDGNSDVDGGATSLVSPAFDLSGYAVARMVWSYWYTNDSGSNPGTDVWVTEISDDDGASWTTVQSTTASTTAWTTMSIDVGSFVALTSQVRIRFTASDPAPGAVVEAGLDAFRVDACEIANVELLPAACTGAFGLSTIGTSGPALAGASVDLECTAVSQNGGPVFTGFVFGVAAGNLQLPSCGCTIVPTLDILDIQFGNWAAPALESWSVSLALPPSAAGGAFYAQGFVIDPAAASCLEAGLPFTATDALRITVQ